MQSTFEKNVASVNTGTDTNTVTSATNPTGTLPAPQLLGHESANWLPMLPDEEFNRLVEDIRKNELREKIVTLNGKVLDGRNRYNALRALDIAPTLRQVATTLPIRTKATFLFPVL